MRRNKIAFSAGAIVSQLTLNRTQFSAAVKAVKKEVGVLGDKVKRNSEQFKRMGRSMTIAGTAIVATLGLLVKKASDAQETQAKFGTVFQEVTADASKALKVLRKDYGLSRLAAQDMLSATGDLLTGLGMQGAAALSLSEQTQQLAVDLASFTNFSGGAKGASDALTKAMLGERESVKSLGIVITEEMVKERLLTEGKEKLTGQARLQAKAEATLAIAVEQSKNAIGDYQRTKGDLANMTRTLMGRLEDLWVTLGSKLIPVVTKIVGKLQEVVSNVSDWIEANPALTSRLVKFVAVASSLMLVLGPMAIVLPKIVAGMTALKIATTFVMIKLPLLRAGLMSLLGPLGLIAVAAAAVGIALNALIKSYSKAQDVAHDALVKATAPMVTAMALRQKLIKDEIITIDEWREIFNKHGRSYKRVLMAISKLPEYAHIKLAWDSVIKKQEEVGISIKNLDKTIFERLKNIVKEVQDKLWRMKMAAMDFSGFFAEEFGPDAELGWNRLVGAAATAEKEMIDIIRRMAGLYTFDEMGQEKRTKKAIELTEAETEAFRTLIRERESGLHMLMATFENWVTQGGSLMGHLGNMMKTMTQSMIGSLRNLTIQTIAMAGKEIMVQQAKALAGIIASIVKAIPFPLNIAAIGIGIGLINKFFSALPTFGEGGDISRKGGIVGDKGPELFVPDRPGTIIPLKGTAPALGGQGVIFAPNIILNMDAMDSIDVDNFMRNRGMPSIIEALRMNIQLEEFQKVLKIR